MAIFDKKIKLTLDNGTPYTLVLKDSNLKWGRVIQNVESVEPHGKSDVILANKNNTSIIEGTLVYAVECPRKNVEVVISVGVSQGKPYIFHAELQVDRIRVDFAPISERERLKINKLDDDNPDTFETQYETELSILSLAHQ